MQIDESVEKSFSAKELGCVVGDNETIFRLFAPRATEVQLVLFDRHDQEQGKEIFMTRDADGVWEFDIPSILYGIYYGYRVRGPSGDGEMFNPAIVIADPYSKAVVTKNTYRHPAKTLILRTDYDWEGDSFIIPENHNELIIYEAHMRDLTAHPSSGVMSRGTYAGLIERGRSGGLSYLKDLGVNAIEFLPLQKFGNIEPPYQDQNHVSDTGEVNTWNPYERNHWGYMTSYFFAPESYYATDGTMENNSYNGVDGRAVKELKDVVKALHSEGIAVIMDVVYNHVSQYDYNPFKYIDKFYYFHTDSMGRFLKSSGCGNDFHTSRPMARRLIVDSILYWMKEYHIDGFRFDLATMIDWETCRKISEDAKKINPNVLLIAEAWGGGKYDPSGFSDIGWSSWNDQTRNHLKGFNPLDGQGFIFGRLQENKAKMLNVLTGTLREDGGIYKNQEHSINYLESHDDYTLGDFIRIATREVGQTDFITDSTKNATLTPKQLVLSKLAAIALVVSQGPVMIHEGQEFARSKLIAPTSVPDSDAGILDKNSYEKDDETNWLNYHHRELNRELYEYYKGLLALRKKYLLFGSAPRSAVQLIQTENNFFLAFLIDGRKTSSLKSKGKFIVMLNAADKPATIQLPSGRWSVLVDAEKVLLVRVKRIVKEKMLDIPPTSGMILCESEFLI